MRVATIPAVETQNGPKVSSLAHEYRRQTNHQLHHPFTPSAQNARRQRPNTKQATDLHNRRRYLKLAKKTHATKLTPTSCRQCLHTMSQVNALRCKLRAAHAAYTATQCRDECTFAHIPMLTVRSYKPSTTSSSISTSSTIARQKLHQHQPERRRPWSSVAAAASMKLEIRRHEAVDALFMADDKWVYVKTGDERRGFIPAKCCQPFAFALDPVLTHAQHLEKFSINSANTALNVMKESVATNPSESDGIHSTKTKTKNKYTCSDYHYEHEIEEAEEEDQDLNDLSLFSVSYLDVSTTTTTTMCRRGVSGSEKSDTTTRTTTVATSECVYDNLNEFKSCSSSSSSSLSSSAAASTSDNYAYMSAEEHQKRMLLLTTPTASLSASKKKRKHMMTNTNPYDTLRRCNIQTPPPPPPPPSSKFDSKRLISSESEKKPPQSSYKDNMLFVRIYKKLKVAKAATNAAVVCTQNCNGGDGEYENLDELMTPNRRFVAFSSCSPSSSSSSQSEHIYCNTDFF